MTETEAYTAFIKEQIEIRYATQMAVWEKEIKKHEEYLESGKTLEEQYSEWRKEVRLNDALELAETERQAALDAEQSWMTAAQGMVNSANTAFSAWISGTKSAEDAFRGFAEGVLNSLLQIAQQAAAMKLFNLLFAGGAASNAFLPSGSGRVPVGHGARGGIFPAGRALVTGETGPELQFQRGRQG